MLSWWCALVFGTSCLHVVFLCFWLRCACWILHYWLVVFHWSLHISFLWFLFFFFLFRRSTSFDFMLRCGQKFVLVAFMWHLNIPKRCEPSKEHCDVWTSLKCWCWGVASELIWRVGITFLSIKCSRCVVCCVVLVSCRNCLLWVGSVLPGLFVCFCVVVARPAFFVWHRSCCDVIFAVDLVGVIRCSIWLKRLNNTCVCVCVDF